MKTYKQPSYEERCQIYALNKSQMSQNKIAEQLNVSQSTISRELARNTGLRGYRIKQAQNLAQQRREYASKAIKMTPKLIELINLKLTENGVPKKFQVGLRSMNQSILVMKLFINISGGISNVVVLYSKHYVEKAKVSIT
ncbi:MULTISPECIES: helix-turn-helix domain-containing protein [unclassified Pseudoalteromonas]|uniref:helix-turn-helix domain-containing protein n=1 Tax=Pseudoalteromonas sp. '520P1 No. 423' TaxID=1690037 RepID=UPI000A5299A7|nr:MULTISPECIES: helix-turn-helix domain-containing protein [unclassified Pseudoalteromonas]